MNKEYFKSQLKVLIGHLELTDAKLVVDDLPEEIIEEYDISFIDNEGAISILEEILKELGG